MLYMHIFVLLLASVSATSHDNGSGRNKTKLLFTSEILHIDINGQPGEAQYMLLGSINERNQTNFHVRLHNNGRFVAQKTVRATIPNIEGYIDILQNPRSIVRNFAGTAQYFNWSIPEEEMTYRQEIFLKNFQLAMLYTLTDESTGQYGINPFSYMSPLEFQRTYTTGQKWNTSTEAFKKLRVEAPSVSTAPSAWDWRQKGAVTGVKNQMSCGSCWAFSVTGNIEGQWFINRPSHKLVSLSEQQLVDCDHIDHGCEGGLPVNAYKAIEEMGGLETESQYPYMAADKQCHYNPKLGRYYINGSVAISKDEGQIAAWLAKNSPISIGINANAMQFYMGGISHPWKIFCNPSSLDHGVLIVGYGIQNAEPFWIIKNSWGATWGEKGYYRVYRGSGVCGLNQMCTSAIVK